MDNPFVFIAQIIATLLLITAGHGPGELQSLRMNDTHAAHLLPIDHFTKAVPLTSHSTSTFRHQLPSSTTPSACSDLDSAMVAHRAIRAIRGDDTFLWAINFHIDNLPRKMKNGRQGGKARRIQKSPQPSRDSGKKMGGTAPGRKGTWITRLCSLRR
ncbi:hypothetical protein MRX96_013480 [Rhipicephalus microplus]